MSLRGREVRAFIGDEYHEKLSIMAEHKDAQLAEFAARLLEKIIVAEWHDISLMLDRSARLGKRWKAVEGAQSDLFGRKGK